MNTLTDFHQTAVTGVLDTDAQSQPDHQVIAIYIASKQNPHTRRAYSFEMRRWLAWLHMTGLSEHVEAGTLLEHAQSAQAVGFLNYLQGKSNDTKPQKRIESAGTPKPTKALIAYTPPSILFTPASLQYAQLTSDPSAKIPLTAKSVQRTLSVLKAFYVEAPYLAIPNFNAPRLSPFGGSKGLRTDDSSPRGKALTVREVFYINEALANDDGSRDYNQKRWIWKALAYAGVRRFELAKAKLRDLKLTHDDKGAAQWAWTITGKGGHTETNPVSAAFMVELTRYLESEGAPLPPVPRNDETPFVLPRRGGATQVTPDLINRRYKDLMAEASALATDAGEPHIAELLLTRSSHSGRHTLVTALLDETQDLALAQRIARHRSVSVTAGYAGERLEAMRSGLEKVNV